MSARKIAEGTHAILLLRAPKARADALRATSSLRAARDHPLAQVGRSRPAGVWGLARRRAIYFRLRPPASPSLLALDPRRHCLCPRRSGAMARLGSARPMTGTGLRTSMQVIALFHGYAQLQAAAPDVWSIDGTLLHTGAELELGPVAAPDRNAGVCLQSHRPVRS